MRIVASLALMVFACGGAVDTAIDYGATVFPDPVPNAVGPPGSLGALLRVPNGVVDLGYFRASNQTLVPRISPSGPERTCPTLESVDSIAVRAFRLMEREVTAADYKLCVNTSACTPPQVDLTADSGPGGSWDDPGRRSFPVAVDFQRARTFCRHYGGDLPTEAQWWRALQGDTRQLYGVPFSQQAAACRDANFAQCGLSPLCQDACNFWDHLEKTKSLSLPLMPADTVSYDVGPYGHRHLLGNAAEWVRLQDLVRCGYAVPESHLFSDPNVAATPHCLPSTPVRRVAFMGDAGERDGDTICTDGSGDLEPKVYWYMGFRCAFPE